MNTNERPVESLERLSVERIPGHPGGRVVKPFDLLPGSGINLVRLRDEREASVTVGVHGRLISESGVLAGQGSQIGSLDSIGQMEARPAPSPMVTTAEASECGACSTLASYQQSHGGYSGLELPKILDAVTKEHWFPRTPIETVRSLQLAFKCAVVGRPGPTAIILDGDVVTEPSPGESVPAVWDDEAQTRTWAAAPAARDITAAAEALDTAERPVIVSGNGVRTSGVHDELTAIVEAYEVAVVTSHLGESTFPETHRLAGGVIGSFGHEGTNRLAGRANTLLAVGCRMNPMDVNWQTLNFIRLDEQTTIHAGIDPRNAGQVYLVDMGLTGDALELLRELAAAGGTDNDWVRDRA